MTHEHHHHSHRAHGRPPGSQTMPNGRTGERGRLVLIIVVTTAILLAEVVGGLLSHSLSLLSDAGHMLSDLVAQGLSLAAIVIATRPADARRTYGWYRIEILAALTNGLTLLVLALWIMWQAAHRVAAPVEVHTGLMLKVATVGFVANLFSAWLLHGLSSLNMRSAYLHLLLDSLSSAAVIIGGAIMHFARGAYVADPIISILIGLFVLYSAFRLIREAVDVLLEAVPREIDLAGVTHAIDHVDGVAGVHDLHIWTITSGLHALSAHIVVHADERSAQDQLLNRVKEMLLREFSIAHTTLQLESEDYEHVGHVC
jgi:cobalt-zinc-cadmium efflux system protein